MEDGKLTPELIDLDEWEQSGEGWYGVTYYHIGDDTLLLKLNSESMTYEATLAEYRLTEAVHSLGVKCPSAIRFVTDGKRFGYISERLVGKKSFARILSESPEKIDTLARDMAEACRALHSLPCDTQTFSSVPERLRDEVNSCRWIKEDMKALLNSYADGMRKVTTCLHGDMHPGNYLRADKGDFWIDLGRFGYGDPDMDYASQYMLAYLAPAPMVKTILHVDARTYIRFLSLFGRYYYGEDFDTPQTQERLRRAVCLLVGHAMARTPAGAKIYAPFVKGHGWVTRAVLRMISPFVKVK